MQEFIAEYGWHAVIGLGVLGVSLVGLGVWQWWDRRREARYQANRQENEERIRQWQEKKATKPVPQTYEDQVRAWNELMRKREADIQQAHQDAQALAVEGNTQVLLTIRDYYACPDDEPLTKIEAFPEDDPRRKDLSNTDGEIVVDDQRCLPHEQFGYGFMPRHLREQWVEVCQRRRTAIKAGSLQDDRSARPAGSARSAAPSRITSSDEKLQADIDSMAAYQKRINAAADAAFAEELVKIKADAEQKAQAMLTRPVRRELLVKEAGERGVDVSVVEAEFIKLVVEQAAKRAEEAYRRPNASVLAALTPDKSSKMFVH